MNIEICKLLCANLRVWTPQQILILRMAMDFAKTLTKTLSGNAGLNGTTVNRHAVTKQKRNARQVCVAYDSTRNSRVQRGSSNFGTKSAFWLCSSIGDCKTVQKMKCSIKDFLGKCDQIRRKSLHLHYLARTFTSRKPWSFQQSPASELSC